MKAKLSKIQYTPRKLRLVANQVRGMKAEEALEYLKNVEKKGSFFVYKTIKSAISNSYNSGEDISNLVIEEIKVDASVTYKRYFRESRGSVRTKLKRYSTLSVKLK